MPTKAQIKRYLIISIITCLSFSAFVGILAVLIGHFGELQTKVLLSTIAVGVFSVISLANLPNIDSGNKWYRRFAWLSILLSFVALLFVLYIIWLAFDSDNVPYKPTLVIAILAVASSHASSMLPYRNRSKMLDIAVTTTFSCIAFVAGFLIYLIITESDNISSFFYRLLAVFVILDVFGTIIVPVIAKMMKSKQQNPPTTPNLPPNAPTQLPAASPENTPQTPSEPNQQSQKNNDESN